MDDPEPGSEGHIGHMIACINNNVMYVPRELLAAPLQWQGTEKIPGFPVHLISPPHCITITI